MKIEGRVALVTGATHRVGKSIALALASKGVRVIVHHHHSSNLLKSVLHEIKSVGPEPYAAEADLADPSQIRRLVDTVYQRFGAPDVLVNNAAVFYPTPLAELDEDKWDEILNVNLRAPFICSLLFGRQMQAAGGGKIINIADVAAIKPYKDYIPYCVSKAALIALTRSMARALAPEVQVTCIAPGTVLPPEGQTAEKCERMKRALPLKQFGSPEDISQTVIFIVERGDFMTGNTIVIDGGQLLT